ncbi:MAG: efflux RND transporter periplasmic adaptor subunit, partial [Planctomycetaceae bacterium]|nr:efflux RND transporter periplasmic adaptor subunit [Planctomycetaceae bacterium]
MFRWIKRLLWLFVMAGIVAAVGYGFMPKPIPVDTARVTRGSLAVTVSEDGKSRVRDRYLISSPLAGRLHRIRVRAGDPVNAPPALESLSNGVAATGLEDPPANGNGKETVTPTLSPGATSFTELAVIDPIDPSLLDSRQIAQAEL